ncbi:MAG: hypothetical protein ABUT20_31450, partial [Bacteroidota bacterium]
SGRPNNDKDSNRHIVCRQIRKDDIIKNRPVSFFYILKENGEAYKQSAKGNHARYYFWSKWLYLPGFAPVMPER